MKESVLMLASFEKTVDHLFEGAVHARTDYINGPFSFTCFILLYLLSLYCDLITVKVSVSVSSWEYLFRWAPDCSRSSKSKIALCWKSLLISFLSFLSVLMKYLRPGKYTLMKRPPLLLDAPGVAPMQVG